MREPKVAKEVVIVLNANVLIYHIFGSGKLCSPSHLLLSQQLQIFPVEQFIISFTMNQTEKLVSVMFSSFEWQNRNHILRSKHVSCFTCPLLQIYHKIIGFSTHPPPRGVFLPRRQSKTPMANALD